MLHKPLNRKVSKTYSYLSTTRRHKLDVKTSREKYETQNKEIKSYLDLVSVEKGKYRNYIKQLQSGKAGSSPSFSTISISVTLPKLYSEFCEFNPSVKSSLQSSFKEYIVKAGESGILPSLSKDYIRYKRTHGLSTEMFRATGHGLNSLVVNITPRTLSVTLPFYFAYALCQYIPSVGRARDISKYLYGGKLKNSKFSREDISLNSTFKPVRIALINVFLDVLRYEYTYNPIKGDLYSSKYSVKIKDKPDYITRKQ